MTDYNKLGRQTMTLTPEQIREAVELADGFDEMAGAYWHDSIPCDANKPPRWFIAALASQLISQVDAMEEIELLVRRDVTQILEEPKSLHRLPDLLAYQGGSTRDENSILACTEFLREKGNE